MSQGSETQVPEFLPLLMQNSSGQWYLVDSTGMIDIAPRREQLEGI